MLDDRFMQDPGICGGEPVTGADVRAVIAFAAASAEEDLPVPAVAKTP